MKSHSKSHVTLITTLLLFFNLTSFAQQQSNPCLSAKAVTVVILGSSTAAGTGPTSSDSTWVNRYRAHLQSINPNNQVINLAVGGYTTYRVMPDFFVSTISGRPAVNTAHNITKALTYDPDAIIVNLPSNDRQFPMFEQLQNFDSLYRHSNTNGVPMWITTTQPLGSATWAQYQAQVADSILNIYGSHAIDFWSPLVDVDSTVLNYYDSGDGVHLNNTAHGILAQQIIDADIVSQVLEFDSTADYTLVSVENQTTCSNVDIQYQLIYANIGGIDTTEPVFDFKHEVGGVSTSYSASFSTLNTCELDTLTFTVFASTSGYYNYEASITQAADTSSQNDSLFRTFYLYETPSISTVSDTLCIGQPFVLSASSNADSIYWFTDTLSSAFQESSQLSLPNLTSDTTFYVQGVNGPFFEKDSMFTTDNYTTSYNGIMFNLIADTDMIVDSMALIIVNTGQQSVNIYTRNGSFDGYQSNSTAWTYFTSTTASVTNNTGFSIIAIPSLQLIAGDTVGVYLELSSSSSSLRYKSGLSSPVVRSNGQLNIMTGSGVAHNFGTYYNYRDWNGKVFYHYGSNRTGMCRTPKTAVHAVVSDPQLSLPSYVDIVDTSSVTIHAGSEFATYEWNDLSTDSTLVVDSSFVNTYGPYATVFVTDEFGCMANDYSFINVHITDTGTTNVVESIQANSIRVYPQPARYELYIDTDQSFSNSSYFTMYNIEGKVVKYSPLLDTKHVVDVSDLAPGFYSLEIKTGKSNSIRKVIIQ